MAAEPGPAPRPGREEDAIYQGDRIVARVLDAEVDLEAKEIRFGEIYQSDDLLLSEECEFQKYRILIQHIAFASRIDRSAPHKGRVFKGATADLLGYREH